MPDTLTNNGSISISHHISSGANINIQENDGFTPLHMACQEGNIEIARILIQNNATVDALNKYTVTPLYYAIYYGYENITWLLLDNGAKVSYLSQDPLLTAKHNGQTSFVNRLLGKNNIIILKIDLSIFR